jgi:tetratricopeptide (TPR) repeat protein
MFIYPQDNLSIVRLGNAIGAMPVNFNDEIAGFYDPSMQALRG